MTEYRRLVLARRPDGLVRDDDFEMTTTTVPKHHAGEFLVRVCWLSFDPAQRGWLDDVPSYLPPVQLGEVMRANGIGKVVASRNADFPLGTLVSGTFGWQEYALCNGSGGVIPTRRVPAGVPPTSALGVLGTTGLTAYFGLLDIGRPKPGDTVVVSAAAGATGSVVGQIARLAGASVIGIAGGREKCSWLTQVAGFDAAIDYQNEDVRARIAALAPQGVHVYYDNVGARSWMPCWRILRKAPVWYSEEPCRPAMQQMGIRQASITSTPCS
ncbi:zinc-binding dehydrogenase [Streptomyces sp. NBC_01643]|uniref:zinc-binding dehydrogenase n=1 Tax=Streptomyces sp. NBC_01643 TaxID=2975906 RepID=UPI0038663B60